ncbi:MAG TPA: hypothetical protein PLX89_04010 [Verrucomicrobiota bacterium]|nr:hypothetical protein [Verrucomicrobiota bacterium]
MRDRVHAGVSELIEPASFFAARTARLQQRPQPDGNNSTTVFRNLPRAGGSAFPYQHEMYWYDRATCETVFEWPGPTACPAILVCFLAAAAHLEVPMSWTDGRWQARVKLPDGFHCYGFRSGTRVLPDSAAGGVRDSSGRRRSLVVVPGISPLQPKLPVFRAPGR